MQSRYNRKILCAASLSVPIIQSPSSLLSISKLSKMAFSIQFESSLVSLHLPTVSKWMSRKSRCLAQGFPRGRDRASFLTERLPSPGEEKNRCKKKEKKRNAAMRSPFARGTEGKGVDRDDGKKKKGRRTVAPNISELTLNH